MSSTSVPLGIGRGRGSTWLIRASFTPRLFDLALSLYCASIIIGAGILSLPALTASLGLFPALFLTVVLGSGLAYLYTRIVRTLRDYVAALVRAEYRPGAALLRGAGLSEEGLDQVTGVLLAERARRRGIGVLDEQCAWLGLARPGRFALLVGLLAYVVPAVVGYVIVGGKTLAAVAAVLAQAEFTVAMPLLVSMILGLLSLAVMGLPAFAGRAALGCVLQMAASWAGGVVILLLFPASPALPTLVFAVGTGLLLVRAGGEEGEAASGGLIPAHLVGTTIAVIELILLAGTAAAALWLLSIADEVRMPELVGPRALSAPDLATAIGVLLFAFTGTGIFNLVRYPQLLEGDRAEGRLGWVVAIGALIPTVAYVGWMSAVAATLDPATLLRTDQQLSYPTIPLAAKVAGFGGQGWVIVAAGYFVALLAVTGAAAGFSESLADRLARVWQARRGRGTTAEAPAAGTTRRAQLGILTLATGAATALVLVPPVLPFTTLLTVAGNAGGGLLLLILPLFLPTGGRRRPRQTDIVLATLVAAALFGMNLLALPDGFGHETAATIAGAVILAIDLALLSAFAWLVVSELPDAVTASEPDRPTAC